MQKSIYDIIDSLSKGEKEEHKELIAECIKREESITKIYSKTTQNIQLFCDGLQKITNNIGTLMQANQDVCETIMDMHLRNLKNKSGGELH